MRTALLASTLLAATTMAGHSARAATFVVDSDKSELRVTGHIDLGDGPRFVAALNSAIWRGPFHRIVLDSPGGSIDDALMMAANLDGAATATVPGGMCASACVLILASGSSVTIAPGSRVGVHQGRTIDGVVTWGDSYAMAAFLARHHVAHTVTEKLLAQAGGDCDWLTADDMTGSGWTLNGVAVVEPARPDVHPVQIAAPIAEGMLQCVGTNGRISEFVIARANGGDQLFSSNGDAGDVIMGRVLSQPCRGAKNSFPASTPIAGQWQGPALRADQLKAVVSQPLDINPQAAPEVVQVPRREDLPVAAPNPAAPQVAVVPPPVFRPLPAPADEAFTDVPARCRMTAQGKAQEFDCLIGHAADGSRRVRLGNNDKGPVYLYPNGPQSYLYSFDGRSFSLDMPLTLSSDRLCLASGDFEGCAWTVRSPTLLDGVNALVAGLFGAAISTEQRLGLLGN